MVSARQSMADGLVLQACTGSGWGKGPCRPRRALGGEELVDGCQDGPAVCASQVGRAAKWCRAASSTLLLRMESSSSDRGPAAPPRGVAAGLLSMTRWGRAVCVPVAGLRRRGKDVPSSFVVAACGNCGDLSVRNPLNREKVSAGVTGGSR
mmetsp:Transcript_79333/g.244777  ORF Transcript_79333/g.244777 Transcript_79333/m.244777 type:complete len:151 (-) Transcript_79333:194-646(-)